MKNFIKVSLLSLALVFAVGVDAKLIPVSLGLKGGVNFSNPKIKNIGTKEKTGFNAGLSLDVHLPANLAVMSGLEITTKGGKYKGADVSIDAMYIQLPVHLGYRVGLLPGVRAHFSVGPYFAEGIAGDTSSRDESNSKVEYNTFSSKGLQKFDWGLGLGVGVTFIGMIQVRAGYDHGMIDVAHGDAKYKNRNAYLSAGFLFF